MLRTILYSVVAAVAFTCASAASTRADEYWYDSGEYVTYRPYAQRYYYAPPPARYYTYRYPSYSYPAPVYRGGYYYNRPYYYNGPVYRGGVGVRVAPRYRW